MSYYLTWLGQLITLFALASGIGFLTCLMMYVPSHRKPARVVMVILICGMVGHVVAALGR